MIVVVDASVAALWFLPLRHSDRAALLLAPDYERIAPDLVELEVASVLLKFCRRGEVDAADCAEALGVVLPRTVRMFPSAEHAHSGFEIAIRHGGSIYDATYISLARDADAPIVTGDSGLAEIARRARVRARMIAEGPPPLPRRTGA